jgi:transposase
MGRKAIDPNEKKKLVRLFTKKSNIDLIGEEKIKIECEKLINQLQSEALKKCADESLKK